MLNHDLLRKAKFYLKDWFCITIYKLFINQAVFLFSLKTDENQFINFAIFQSINFICKYE